MVGTDLRPMPHPQVAGRVIDDEAVLVLADSGEVMVLNEVAGRIWELADGLRTVSDIVKVIVDEYEVSEEQALADVQEFIIQMTQKQVLIL